MVDACFKYKQLHSILSPKCDISHIQMITIPLHYSPGSITGFIMPITKEISDHLMGAIKDVIEKGVKPDHVAAFLVGQVVYMFKESGYPDEKVMEIVDKTLGQFPKPH